MRTERASTRSFLGALLALQVFLALPARGQGPQGEQERPAARFDQVLWADTVLQARGLSVTDDGTIVFVHESHSVPVKLARVALPSPSSTWGEAALATLASAVENERLEIVLEGGGEPHRARVYAKGRNLGEILVRRGLARYCQGTRHDAELEAAAAAALSDSVGLWSSAEARSSTPACPKPSHPSKTP